MRNINSIKDVVGWGLCVGCGACQYFCGKDSIELRNIESIGIRPFFKKENDKQYTECLRFCPGYSIGQSKDDLQKETSTPNSLIGQYFEIWQGNASDEDIRYNASSGGALTALALYCVEKENMSFVLHTGMNPNIPWQNMTTQSFNKEDLLQKTGSRYAPSSPCEALSLIENSSRACVFIGKPCDAAAISQIRKYRPKLDANIGLVLTFFCAGPPCTAGTLSLLTELNIEKQSVNSLRYRGKGWPGHFKVQFNNMTEEKNLTYEESWGKLVKYPRSFRCNLCPDGLGEFADISCGDAWHIYNKDVIDNGRSLVLARSKHGQTIINKALKAGYLHLEPATANDVVKAQPLTGRRKEIFGRLLAMKTLLIPVPKYVGFSLGKLWLELPLFLKIKTYLGTLKRLLTRGLWHQKPLNPL